MHLEARFEGEGGAVTNMFGATASGQWGWGAAKERQLNFLRDHGLHALLMRLPGSIESGNRMLD